MHEYPEQSTLVIGETPLLAAERVDIDSNTRVYYVDRGAASGFDFFVAAFAASPADSDERPYMDRPDTQVECLFHGVAYFDGVRHLYMGDEASDNEGYLYYVQPPLLVRVFAALAGLEARLCSSRDSAERVQIARTLERGCEG